MQQRYTKTAVSLHWLMAILIVAAFGLGLTMTDIPGITPTKLRYFSWHKWLGVTLLGLACLRLLWRLAHPAPVYPASMSAGQKTIASATHFMLYLLMFAVPVSGYFYTLAAGVPVVYLGLLPLPVLIEPNVALKPLLKGVHYWLNMLFLAAFVLHVLGALKHLLWQRDGLFQRILP